MSTLADSSSKGQVLKKNICALGTLTLCSKDIFLSKLSCTLPRVLGEFFFEAHGLLFFYRLDRLMSWKLCNFFKGFMDNMNLREYEFFEVIDWWFRSNNLIWLISDLKSMMKWKILGLLWYKCDVIYVVRRIGE